MVLCYIGIGSNLGNRRKFIKSAIDEMKKVQGIKVWRASSVYETDPVSDIPQGKFLNGVVEIETALEPKRLLAELKRIEESLGRRRRIKNGPRTIDLDILYYGDLTVNDEDLVIPHPRINEREFVLRGLRELNR